MHYLGLALYAEGRTDDRFLGPVLRRSCEDLCAVSAHPVEMNGEMLLLRDVEELKHQRRDERIVGAAQQARGAWNLLFVHADADGDAVGARRERTQPAIDLLQSTFDGQCHGIAVIPVRCTESWALCDGNALRQAFGTTLDDRILGIPAFAKGVENLTDPKRCLEVAFEASLAGACRKSSRSVNERLGLLGEQVELQRLRYLSAFQAMEAELKNALRALQVIS